MDIFDGDVEKGQAECEELNIPKGDYKIITRIKDCGPYDSFKIPYISSKVICPF